MGYGTRNGSIRTFWPDDNDNEFYIEAAYSRTMADILEMISQKWPGCSMSDITITTEHIHTDCLDYDQYDSGDWTLFLLISRNG